MKEKLTCNYWLQEPTVLTHLFVFLRSLSTIANRRPAFYGRILPVLLGLDRSGTIFNGLHAPGVHFALKNAFLNCLKCTHPGALPVNFLD